MTHFERNIGLLTMAQQETLGTSSVVVAGVGGMGGVAAEALVRMGIGEITILDHDRYELTNINRQLHCTEDVIGERKVDVVAKKLKSIHGKLKIHSYDKLTEENVETMLAGADIIINGMDDLVSSIILEREARRQKKTIVDAWLTPYASVFVMTPTSPHWEEFLDFPTAGKALKDITKEDVEASLRKEVAFTLSHFDAYSIVSRDVVDKVVARTAPRPSLLPVVWMSGTLMANEAMKILTGQGRIATHWGVFYNQYEHEMKFFEAGASSGKAFRTKHAG